MSSAWFFFLLGISKVFSDEFSDPSHTPSVQVLFPRRNSCVNQSFRLVFVAPSSSLVRIFIDQDEVALVSGAAGYGEFVGVSDGDHT